MDLDALARCLAQCAKDGDASRHDATWLKMERLLRMCPNCQFKTLKKTPAIQSLADKLHKQEAIKYERLIPKYETLLDIKPDSIYNFGELEQEAVLAVCKYLSYSRGQYIEKLLPLILRYLATLHLAKWPHHYFRNLLLLSQRRQMKSKRTDTEPAVGSNNAKDSNNNNNSNNTNTSKQDNTSNNTNVKSSKLGTKKKDLNQLENVCFVFLCLFEICVDHFCFFFFSYL